MTMTTANSGAILTPAQVADLLVAPVQAMSVAAAVSRVVNIASGEFRIPRVTADPSARWVNEGEEIPPSDAEMDEATVVPAKVAGLTIITRELADDSTPEAAQAVGDGLARDIARRVDEAFFGDLPSPAPAGLEALTGVTEVEAPADWTDVDPFSEALYAAEAVNARVGAWVTNPADALSLSQVRESTGSNKSLLQPDPTQAGRRIVGGVPLLTSPYVAAGTVYGIPDGLALLVIREDVEVTTDRSVFFTSDRVAVRGIMRVGFGFPYAASVVKITRDAG